jgi:hypothetical protein
MPYTYVLAVIVFYTSRLIVLAGDHASGESKNASPHPAANAVAAVILLIIFIAGLWIVFRILRGFVRLLLRVMGLGSAGKSVKHVRLDDDYESSVELRDDYEHSSETAEDYRASLASRITQSNPLREQRDATRRAKEEARERKRQEERDKRERRFEDFKRESARRAEAMRRTDHEFKVKGILGNRYFETTITAPGLPQAKAMAQGMFPQATKLHVWPVR